MTTLYCPDDARRALVRTDPTLNGIDHIEVLDEEAPPGSPRQQTLLVHCFKSVTGSGLSASNVRIEGGVRITPVRVEWMSPAEDASGLLSAAEQDFVDSLADAERVLLVRTRERGDLSTYRLRLVLSREADGPPQGFDLLRAAIDFSFKVECPSEFDCFVDRICTQIEALAPNIDYLAKDYASFRRLMLDRLALTLPDFKERSPADIGIALVELLAYVGDYLSYYQDAVAGEAYLGTARRRASVRRHARLVDYFVGDGCNARAWMVITVDPSGGADGATLPAGSRLLGGDPGVSVAVAATELPVRPGAAPVAFETLHPLELGSSRNRIRLYTWGDPNCCLLDGATGATLWGGASELGLRQGDVLIFEEVLGRESGLEVDADPARRHVVRLDRPPVEITDPATGETVLDVHWHHDDALPFSLSLKEFDDGKGNVRGATVAWGNVVLADSGLSVEGEELNPGAVPFSGRYRPSLQQPGLTHSLPYDDEQQRGRPASSATEVDLRLVSPRVHLEGDGRKWTPQRDLLNSDRFSPEFVVEMEDDGRAYLRFGDGSLGRAPSAGATFTATYRIGNGSAANVGAGAITRIVTDLEGITAVRNPLPATGGRDPEAIDRVRLHAPQAFRVQRRAVTENDYADIAGRHPDVQKAAATRRWTGSWYTMFVTVDRRGGRPVDESFETEMRAYLERFRLAGYDLEIDAPRFVPLDVAFTVCVEDGHFRSNVKAALLEAFGNRNQPDGRRGFFHPDNFTFGQPVYLSRIVAAAMEVPGVAWIDTREGGGRPNRFRRWGEESHAERDAGMIEFGRLEIAQLDNDPNFPENGHIDFIMRGGL